MTDAEEGEYEDDDTNTEGVSLLIDSGLIFEINNKILHPLGIAIGVDSERKNLIIEIDQATPERFVFAKEIYLKGKKKRDAYMRQVGNNILKLRQKRLGYIIQGPHDG